VSYLEISPARLSIAVALVAIAIAMSRALVLDLAKDLVIGAIRAAAQLFVIGYVLLFLFGHESPWWVMAALLVMLAVATATSVRRVEHGPPARVLLPYALAAVAGGAVLALVPVFALVIRPEPWFEARYIIPISGMMLSSAMNVVAQVLERMFALARSEAPVIEQLLALGASPQQATRAHVRASIRAAMIPTINGLLTVGLVALPGMMTGQIVSGESPELAVRYQIVIMYQLVAVAAVSGTLAALFARKLLFTPREQLRVDALRK
jgi:putative ABC transport system permease protein